MKKRMISLITALCIICGLLAACGSESESKSTAETINEAIKKTQALDSITAEMETQMDMVMEGMTISVPTTTEIKAKGLQGDNPVSSSSLSTIVSGESVDLELYQEGEWIYFVLNDWKYKVGVADAKSELGYTNDVNGMLKELPAELLQDVTPIQNENGSQTVSLSIPDEQFAVLYSDLIAQYDMGSDADVSEVEISNAGMTVTITDGYVSFYDMEFTMTMEINGVSSAIGIKVTINYKDLGTEVTVTPPADYQTFETFDLSSLNLPG